MHNRPKGWARRSAALLGLISMSLALAACGGGGGDSSLGVASTPPPPPAPPPPPPPPPTGNLNIFPAPATQEFAAIGSGTPLRIRYDAASDQYQVKAGDRDWDVLADDPLSAPLEGSPNQNFIFQSTASQSNSSYFSVRAHHQASPPEYRYHYSNLAPWAIRTGPTYANSDGGYVAFGSPTPTGSVPTSGSGTYTGLIEGTTTLLEAAPPNSQYDPGDYPALIDGSVTLRFDFAAGTLAGEIRPRLYRFAGRDPLPTLSFVDTIFGIGRTDFSGRFGTNLPGPNSLSGRFTGPQAQELIGRWAFPFTDPADGSVESAQGAMIGKRE